MELTEELKQNEMYAGYNENNKEKPHDVPREKSLKELLEDAEERKRLSRFAAKKAEIKETIKEQPKIKKTYATISDLTKDEKWVIVLFNQNICISEIHKITSITKHFIRKYKEAYRHLILLTDEEMNEASRLSKEKNSKLKPRKLSEFSTSVFKLFNKGWTNEDVAIKTKRSLSYIKQVRMTYNERTKKGIK